MNTKPGFDKALLDRPWIERLEFFRLEKVPHARLKEVTEEINRAIILRASEGFIFIVGPTRIGKTTVCKAITNSILRDHLQEIHTDPGFLPIAGMEATAYSTRYNWRDHWVESLKAMNEPLIDHKIDYDKPSTPGVRATEMTVENRREATLRGSFENTAAQRRLKVFTIDEAQHLTLVPSARLFRSQIEIIKSAASKSGAMHLLFGTYDLLQLRNASGQLGTRAVTVHFDRYRSIANDLESFAQAVKSLALFMPFPEPPDFLDEKAMDYIFETSLGCIGLVKVWFVDALGGALEAGKKTLSLKDLNKHAPPIDVRDKISEEILKGEEALEEDHSKLDKIRLRMSFGVKSNNSALRSTQTPAGSALTETEPNTSASPQSKPKRRKRRPGERNPKRDLVGASRKRLAAARRDTSKFNSIPASR